MQTKRIVLNYLKYSFNRREFEIIEKVILFISSHYYTYKAINMYFHFIHDRCIPGSVEVNQYSKLNVMTLPNPSILHRKT